MKTAANILFGLLLLCRSGHAQGFVNLNFEQSVLISSNYDSVNNFYTGTAFVPGWLRNGTNLFLYNLVSSGTPNVTLVGKGLPEGSIDGAFSMQLEAFGYGNISVTSETGSVPVSAESLLFKAQPGAGTLGFNQWPEHTIFCAVERLQLHFIWW